MGSLPVWMEPAARLVGGVVWVRPVAADVAGRGAAGGVAGGAVTSPAVCRL